MLHTRRRPTQPGPITVFACDVLRLHATEVIDPTSLLAVTVRAKSTHQRTYEEKSWVALDLVLNPQYYRTLPPEEVDALTNDPAYEAPVSGERLRALVKLPCSTMEALPHLRNATVRKHWPLRACWLCVCSCGGFLQELRVHALLAKYTHGFGENSEKERDQMAGALAAAAAAVARGYIAQHTHPDLRSMEEAEWVALDALLFPDRYRSDHAGRPIPAGAQYQVPEDERLRKWQQELQAVAARDPSRAEEVQRAIQQVTAATEAQRVVGTFGLSAPVAERLRARRYFYGDGVEVQWDGRPASLPWPLNTLEEGGEGEGEGEGEEADDAGSMNGAGSSPHKPSSKQQFKHLLEWKKRKARASNASQAAQDKANGVDDVDGSEPSETSASEAVKAVTTLSLLHGLTFTQERLQQLLQCPSSAVTNAAERRVQLLLRAYGSDGGQAMARAALAHTPPIVNTLQDAVSALGETADALTASKERSFIPDTVAAALEWGNTYGLQAGAIPVQHLAQGIGLSHRMDLLLPHDLLVPPPPPLQPAKHAEKAQSNVAEAGTATVAVTKDGEQQLTVPQCPVPSDGTAAVAMASAAELVLADSSQTMELLRLDGVELEKGVTTKHEFDVPGSLAAALLGSAVAPKDMAQRPGGPRQQVPVLTDITVYISFAGRYTDEGYEVARLAGNLYREPFVDPEAAQLTDTTEPRGPQPSLSKARADLGSSRRSSFSTASSSLASLTKEVSAIEKDALPAPPPQRPTTDAGWPLPPTGASGGASIDVSSAAAAFGLSATSDKLGLQDSQRPPLARSLPLPLQTAKGLLYTSSEALAANLLDRRRKPAAAVPVIKAIAPGAVNEVIALHRWPIGYARASEAQVCTPDSLGQLIIRHEPLQVPVTPGKYSVDVSGYSKGSYSIRVVARLAFPLRDLVEEHITNYDEYKARIPVRPPLLHCSIMAFFITFMRPLHRAGVPQ